MIKNINLIVLSILLLGINAWYLLAPYGVSHDTSVSFETFYFFYNHFYLHHSIAQWMPYYSFGIPSHYWQLFALTPLSYFFILTGYLFKISNVLLMFKLSVIAEQYLCLLGMYLLSKQLFTCRGTIFIICLGSIASLFSHEQVYFDFRMYYMFPLAAYFLVRFFKEKRPEFFWLTWIMVLAWEIGNTLYFVFLWIPLLLILTIYLALRQTGPGIFKCLLNKSLRNLGSIALLVIIAFCFYYQLKTFTNTTAFLSRSPDGKNSLYDFLTFATSFDILQSYFKRFICGDNLGSYIGLLPIIFFIWGITKIKRNAFYTAFLLATMVLLWFSFAGVGAAFLYLFPGVPYYRHLAFVYGLVKILILICAGFGLDLFWSIKLKEKISTILLVLLALIFLSDACGFTKQWLPYLVMPNQIPFNGWWAQLAPDLPLFRFALYGLAAGIIFLSALLLPKNKIEHPNFAKSILIIAFCIDIFSFQYHSYKDVSGRILPLPKEFVDSLRTNNGPYQPQRTETPTDERGLDVLIALNGGTKYTTVYSVAQFSPCKSPFRLDLQPINMSKLLSIKGTDKETLNQILGCDAPKLRLENNLVLSNDGLDKPISKPSLALGQINITGFNNDELTLSVDAPINGAWLIYADTYHPGWQAIVNGINQPINKAYGAFKALHLQGHNTVRLYFNDGLSTMCSYVIMCFGIMMSLLFMGLFFRTLYQDLLWRGP